MPRITRPRESTSSVATCLATTNGLRIGNTMTDVPNRTRWVMDATKASDTSGSNTRENCGSVLGASR